MDGVTILNTYSDTNSIITLLIACIILSLLSIFAVYAVSERFSKFNGYVLAYIIMGVLCIVGIVSSIVILCTLPKKPQTLYEVTISDDVSFTEFMDKYYIVNQRGEIYIVKERENNDREGKAD